MVSRNPHHEVVDAWAAQVAGDLSSHQIIDAFDEAFGRLWRRAQVTLGDVTLTAISDRVLYTASLRFPLLEAVRSGAGGFQLEELRACAEGLDSAELLAAARFVLTEFLTVLGKLVAEILTPALHAELAKVAASDHVARDEAYQKDEES